MVWSSCARLRGKKLTEKYQLPGRVPGTRNGVVWRNHLRVLSLLAYSHFSWLPSPTTVVAFNYYHGGVRYLVLLLLLLYSTRVLVVPGTGTT